MNDEELKTNFLAAIRNGQAKLVETPAVLGTISSVFDVFGAALMEASAGCLGVACVTKGAHQPIPGNFIVGEPMSVILVVQDISDVPSPIVAEMAIDPLGFPVTLSFGLEAVVASNGTELTSALSALARSGVFASAFTEYSRRVPVPARLS